MRVTRTSPISRSCMAAPSSSGLATEYHLDPAVGSRRRVGRRDHERLGAAEAAHHDALLRRPQLDKVLCDGDSATLAKLLVLIFVAHGVRMPRDGDPPG